jgi:hypothetical protein
MKKIICPPEYNYLSVFLTLRCNFKCQYCVNEKSDRLIRARRELNAEEWIEGINRLDISDDIAVTISGGEPTMHKDFYKIMTGIDHPIDLLTNFEFDVIKFIHSVDPNKMFHCDIPGYKSVRASFHPDFMEIKEVVAKAVVLQDAGFNVGILPLNFPNSIEFNLKLAEEARKNKVYTFIKDYLGGYNGRMIGHYEYPDGLSGKKHDKVLCKTQELLISPSGEVFKCHRDLYADLFPVGSLLHNDFEIEYKYRECDNFGFCNPCDVKTKVNRFLKMGNCSVTILKKGENNEDNPSNRSAL